MKKPFRRIAALTLSAVLALSCCGGALAAEADSSLPTVTEFEQEVYDCAAANIKSAEEAEAILPKTVRVKLDDSDDYTSIPAHWKYEFTENENGVVLYWFSFYCGEEYKQSATTEALVCNKAADKTIAKIIGDTYIYTTSDKNTIEAITAELNAAYPSYQVQLCSGDIITLKTTWSVYDVTANNYLNGQDRVLSYDVSFPSEYFNLIEMRVQSIGIDVTVSHDYDPNINDAPTAPTEPVEPEKPEPTPDTPTEPTEPEKPAPTPDTPTEPTEPEKPAPTPDSPTEPAEPEKPAPTPDTPTEPAEPEKPAPTPDTPADPTEPEKPAPTPDTSETPEKPDATPETPSKPDSDSTASGTASTPAPVSSTATSSSGNAKAAENKAKSPKTADESQILLAVSVFSLSVAALTGAAVSIKKRKDA